MRRGHLLLLWLSLLLAGATASPRLRAQGSPATETTAPQTTGPDSSQPADSADSSPLLTLFPHSNTARYWISGQANIILQWHSAFPAAYSGKNSLRSHAENDTSKLYTLYLGYEVTGTTEV
ncbi:MAG: hypothetical protein WBE88_00410, partial [Candidatus Acidiferrales bacterium]